MKALIIAASLALSGCAGLSLPVGAPPQASPAVTKMSRTALDFALNSFDATLYGLDFAMDVGKIVPGSEQAKRIAAAGRKVQKFLGAAEAAYDMQSAETYEEAFAKAGEALREFRALLGGSPTASLAPLNTNQRTGILARAAA